MNENLSSKFSSNSKNYEPGNLLRGFLLITTSGDKQEEYAFVIKSDIFEESKRTSHWLVRFTDTFAGRSHRTEP